MRLLIIFLFIGVCACGQQPNKNHIVDPKARQLNDSATLLAMYQEYDKAILLLEQATQIDSNYLTAYANKLAVQLQLNKFDNALESAYNLKRIKPLVADYYATIGMIYEFKGDTIASKKFFNEAVIRYDIALHIMSAPNMNYDMMLMNKAIALILVGQQQNGNEILKQLYDRQNNESFKEIIASFMNKSRPEILNELLPTK